MKCLNNIKGADLHRIIEKKNPIILDVRTSAEVKSRKLNNSINIDIRAKNFDKALDKLPKDREYIVYCASGIRSTQAAKKMCNLGFKKVYNLKGGISRLKINKG